MSERKDYYKDYYRKNREKIIKRATNWNIRNREKFRKSRSKSARKLREKLKAEIFELLGDKCVRCDFADPRALQIDHIHGKGKQEIRSFGNSTYYYAYVLKQLKSGSKDYQLLCANCNWIKRSENREFHS